MKITVAVLIVSDRCSQGLRADASGPAVKAEAERRGWPVVEARIVPDEVSDIEAALCTWCEAGVSLILTTGGTGLSPRDVTPEATRRVVDKELPGFGEIMRLGGTKASPRAILSRAVSGSHKRTLIVNLPGSPKGAVESLSCVADLIPHALAMLCGNGHPKSEHVYDHA